MNLEKAVVCCVLISMTATQSFAQNMDVSSSKNEIKAAPSEITNLLKEDNTSELTYVNGRFVCHNFASTLYLSRSSLVTTLDAYDLEGINIDWGIIVNRLAESSKLPIYYVSLANKEHGFYHAINAVLVNPDKPDEIASYIFIEPQTDETFLTAQEVYDEYRHYYDKSDDEEILKLSIATFDEFKKSGPIYQSITNNLYEFDLKFK